MALIPAPALLHVVDTARQATEINAGLVLAATLIFATVAVALWWPALARLVRGPARRAGPFVVGLVVVAAILPSVLPYDHLVPVGDDHANETHSSHCHVTPGSCADAPVSAGPGQFVFSDPLIVMPALVVTAFVLVSAMALHGQSPRPDVRPPLPVTA